ncbi:hypothetical protein F0562_005860 [Nyssa sinensis]|uniref:Wall-associated receptor kinase C-terminal domain-containing protein n=1 Tax=Nyssa sinensis TaxID=561372 RepID=A0A5J5ANF7_9ASTE|nr:hypothetical protein F0562_005860 [Nyssa sinensis]
MLQLSGDLYQVRKINSSENTLTIAYPEVTAGICPVARYGVTLNTSSLLNYTIDDKMVRFFYNCTLYPPSLPSIACLQYGAKRSYVFMEGAIPEFDWQRYCDSIVTVPVIDSDLQLINGFGRALQDGFKLAWQPDVACQSCEATGGFCGYDNGNGNGLHPNPKFVCFCADGQHFANCRDKGV